MLTQRDALLAKLKEAEQRAAEQSEAALAAFERQNNARLKAQLVQADLLVKKHHSKLEQYTQRLEQLRNVGRDPSGSAKALADDLKD